MMRWRPSVPMILQTEASECGLACLCMIAAYHGREMTLVRARQQFNISLNGTRATDLIEMGHAVHLQGRAFALDLDEIGQLKLPAVLHLDMNHFAVLERRAGRCYVLNDPATGQQRLTLAQLSKRFTGVALEFEPTPEFRRAREPQRPSLGALTRSLTGLRRVLPELIALSFALQIFALGTPYLFQRVVDDVLSQHQSELLLSLSLGLAFIAVFQATTEAVRRWCIAVVGSRVSYQLVANVMAHLLRLPLGYFEKRHVGDILMRFNSVQALQVALTSTSVAALVDLIVAAATAIVMLAYQADLALIAIGSTTALLTLRLLVLPRQRQLQEAVIQAEGREQTFTIETLRSVQSLRATGTEHARQARWSTVFSRLVNDGLKLSRFNLIMGWVEQTVAGLQHVLVIAIAARAMLEQEADALTLGALFAFIAYKGQYTTHATALVSHVMSFKLLDLHLQRLADILWQAPDVAERAGSQGLACDDDIRTDRLSYSYSSFESPVLQEVSLRVPAGSMVAIIGASGCGKTTLLKLLLGLYRPTSGKVLLGQTPLTPANAPAWRDAVGAVLQEDQLISGTVADNIVFHRDDGDMARVAQAAELAGLHDEIVATPMGYLSLVGDLGTSMSSGQRQRLLIARALYRQPRVLMLDEGTANLDAQTEARLTATIRNLGITRIVVAHRPALIQAADQVFELTASGLVDRTTSRCERPSSGGQGRL